jgi:hypothetical protein
MHDTIDPDHHLPQTGATPIAFNANPDSAAAAVGAVDGQTADSVRAGSVTEVGRGKTIARTVDPSVEDAYWSQNYCKRPYYDPSIPYEEYRPAYRYGWEARAIHSRCAFEAVEAELKMNWESARAQSTLSSEKAMAAVRDAWDRVDRILSLKFSA